MLTGVVTIVAAYVVLAVWLAASLWGMLTGDYQGLQLVTPVMLIVAGAIFARGALSKVVRNGENGSHT